MLECGVAWFAHREDGWEAASQQTMAATRTSPSSGSTSATQRGCSRACAATTSRSCCYEPEAGVLRAQQAVHTLTAPGAGARRAGSCAARARPDGGTRRARATARGSRRDLVVWACGGWLARPIRRPRVARASPARSCSSSTAAPPWRVAGRPAGSTTTARCTAPRDIDGLGVKAALDVEGPPLDPDAAAHRPAERRSASCATTPRERFPALARAPSERGSRVPLRAVTRLALHRRAAIPSTSASGSSAAAPATASSTGPRWPSGSPPRSPAEAPLPDRFALGGRIPGRSLRTAGSGVVT